MLIRMTPQYGPPPTPDDCVPVVLDTNVVLDWLVFGDADGSALGRAVAAGRLRWVATLAMRDEFAHVVARDAFDRWRPALPEVWAAWDRYCAEAMLPEPSPHLRCTDPDDQMFIDLAAHNARGWLLSRDRAVLKLGPRLSRLGIRVATPARWIALQGPAC